MRNKKTITLTNYEGHQYDPSLTTPWSDTWATFFKGKRNRVSLGPCIEAYDPDKDYRAYDPLMLPEGDWEFCLPFGDSEEGVPVVFANTPDVTKKVIEDAIGWYLRAHQQVSAPLRFRWAANRNRLFLSPL